MHLVQQFIVSFTKMYHLLILSAFFGNKMSYSAASYVGNLLLPLTFPPLPLLSVFPQALLYVSILFFRQSSFYPCSVWCPPVDSAFHHPACSQETMVAVGHPAASFITHVTCSRHAFASGRGKHVHSKSVFTTGQWKKMMLLPLQALSKLPALHSKVTLSALYEMAHNGREPYT